MFSQVQLLLYSIVKLLQFNKLYQVDRFKIVDCLMSIIHWSFSSFTFFTSFDSSGDNYLLLSDCENSL